MSQFNFENELNSVLRMDAPISKGPSIRWQRKEDCNASVNSSLNVSTTSKTPMKNVNRSVNNPKTPSTGSGAITPKSQGIIFVQLNLIIKKSLANCYTM